MLSKLKKLNRFDIFIIICFAFVIIFLVLMIVAMFNGRKALPFFAIISLLLVLIRFAARLGRDERKEENVIFNSDVDNDKSENKEVKTEFVESAISKDANHNTATNGVITFNSKFIKPLSQDQSSNTAFKIIGGIVIFIFICFTEMSILNILLGIIGFFLLIFGVSQKMNLAKNDGSFEISENKLTFYDASQKSIVIFNLEDIKEIRYNMADRYTKLITNSYGPGKVIEIELKTNPEPIIFGVSTYQNQDEVYLEDYLSGILKSNA